MRNGPNDPNKQIKTRHCIPHKNCIYVYNQKKKLGNIRKASQYDDACTQATPNQHSKLNSWKN